MSPERMMHQINLMGVTQERQRNIIQGFNKSQSTFIDELVEQDTRIANLQAELANVEARLDLAVKLMNQEASQGMICDYENQRRELGL